MSKPKVKIVIGANYGDEGKGLATDYFTQKAKGPVLNVLYNGGPQRGHTVEHKNGLRHIFHHFGSGFFSGASTYFDENFLVDPIKFNIEHCELLDQARYFTDMTEAEAQYKTTCYANPNCRVITPWDAMANQILQKKHNTCGCGIWQTIERYNVAPHAETLKALIDMNDWELARYLRDISWWNLFQIVATGKRDLSSTNTILQDYADIWFNEDLIQNFIYDIRQMGRRIRFVDLNDIDADYDTIIFEGGQGLALNGEAGLTDLTNSFSCKDLTPSDTGSSIPVSLCKDISEDVEICYITRTYVTRHGEGHLDRECTKEDLGVDEIDITNKPNKFQGDLRYGYFDWNSIYRRIDDDYGMTRQSVQFDIDKTLMITHYDPTDFIMDTDKLTRFDDCYVSSSRYSEEVEVWHS